MEAGLEPFGQAGHVRVSGAEERMAGPPHYQRLTNAVKRLFVAKSIGKSTGFYLLACASLPPGAAFGMIWPVATCGGLRRSRKSF